MHQRILQSVLLSLLLLAGSGRLYGQSAGGMAYDWLLVGTDTGSDEQTYYSSKVTHTPQGTVVTWVKLTYSNGATELLGRVEYDCRDRWRWLTAVVYDPQGNITASVMDPSFASEWGRLEPATTGELLEQVLCGRRM